MNTENDITGASVKFPPPFVFLISMIVAFGVQHFRPIDIGNSLGFKFVGLVVVILGISIVIFIRRSFHRVETNIEPWKPTNKIISTGFYAYSRNPIYIALCLVSIGLGILFNSFWILISFIPSIVIVYYIAIKKEEVYLEKKFGEEYNLYKKKVRRWL